MNRGDAQTIRQQTGGANTSYNCQRKQGIVKKILYGGKRSKKSKRSQTFTGDRTQYKD